MTDFFADDIAENRHGERMRDTNAEAPTQNGLLPGFADPVNGAQSTFRSLLHALSHPGCVVPLHADATDTSVPPGFSLAMTAVLLTLVDSDTALWLPPGVSEATRQFLRFHCACRFVETPAQARFVAVPAGFAIPSLNTCDQGDPAFPDRSTTLIIEVEALFVPDHVPDVAQNENREPVFVLRGPGIEYTQPLAVHGLPDDFVQQWQGNQQHFPLGVDVFFTCSTTVPAIAGLPRTTRLEN